VLLSVPRVSYMFGCARYVLLRVSCAPAKKQTAQLSNLHGNRINKNMRLTPGTARRIKLQHQWSSNELKPTRGPRYDALHARVSCRELPSADEVNIRLSRKIHPHNIHSEYVGNAASCVCHCVQRCTTLLLDPYRPNARRQQGGANTSQASCLQE
jgi:hypothetical protein